MNGTYQMTRRAAGRVGGRGPLALRRHGPHRRDPDLGEADRLRDDPAQRGRGTGPAAGRTSARLRSSPWRDRQGMMDRVVHGQVTGSTHASALSRRVAATIGVLAVWAALGVGHLTAGLLSAASSPLLAVGDAVVRLSPEPLIEFAKTTFGTNDKLVLLGAMFVVITLVGAVAGLLSRERPNHGRRGPRRDGRDRCGGGLLRAGVRRARPRRARDGDARGDRRLPLAAPPRSAGPAAGRGGRGRRVAAGRCSAAGPRPSGSARWRRRASARWSRATSRPPAPRSPHSSPARPTRNGPRPLPAAAAFPQLGTPTFLTANSDFYRIDTALRIPTLAGRRLAAARARDGRAGAHAELRRPDRPPARRASDHDDLRVQPGRRQPHLHGRTSSASRCATSCSKRASTRPLTSCSAGARKAGTPAPRRRWCMEPERGALLAIGMNGEALPPEHGFPVRMVVPGLYGYVSGTKWVVDLEATTFANPFRQGFWLERGWSQLGPIKTMSRIDAPQDSATVPADTVTVAGIAWAQHTGIAKVEVRVDGGPWQAAELSDGGLGRHVADVARRARAARGRATPSRRGPPTRAATPRPNSVPRSSPTAPPDGRASASPSPDSCLRWGRHRAKEQPR